MPEPITAAAYADIFGADDDFLESHCFTYVRAIGPEDLLRELRAPRPTAGTAATGVNALRELTTESNNLGFTSERAQLVGVTPVGDWTLMVEYNGLAGVEPEVMLPATRGRTAVSHMANVAPGEPFYWYENGSVRLSYYEDAYLREGDCPDELLGVMREVGFGPLEDPDEDEVPASNALANFALAHHVTGVRLTRRLLQTAEFTCGVVTLPDPPHLRA
ncbi:DUF6461 domain-containing protein [Streptomyces sp. AC512_CC834]|uniref:DUF6461 domain-containing protein n=1 Tax=Streptomyces sp. AC512_CC834 TaxID=2823691 RepID=UPI0027E3BD6B|nr:DUF6461 domain-containing protein [Streptomyces sp. AC512_CC834]